MTAVMPAAEGGTTLVTGASGFVGKFLLRQLLDSGFPGSRIAALARSSERKFPEGIRTVTGDLTDRASVVSVIRNVRPAAVIHLAAIAEPARASASPDQAWAINFNSVRFLAESLLAHAPAARFIFAGSAEAYGTSFLDHDGPIAESAALRPVSTYGATKAAADILLGQMAWQGLRAVRFRAFNHTGPGQSSAYVVASFASQIAEIEAGLKPALLEVGNLNSRRDFLDVRDVVRAYVLALSADLDFIAAPVFNVCSGQPRQISSLLEQLLAMSSAKVEIRVDPARVRASEVVYALGSCKAAERDLAWHRQIEFDSTLRDMMKFSRDAIRQTM
jgi:GDP-4-dehydro-6-deoxy-D-mannose reductase